MWTKTLTVIFKKQSTQVLLWFDSENDDNKCQVKVQSMMNEYFLLEEILFKNRDAAYDFIKNYPQSMALAFVVREGANVGAYQ